MLKVDEDAGTGVCRQCGPVELGVRMRRGRKIIRCSTALREQRASPNRHTRPTVTRPSWLNGRKPHGLTRAEAAAYVEGKVCAICGRGPDDGVSVVVDHCHRQGHIRGALCGNCNSGLGFFADDLKWLASAIRYLTAEPPPLTP